MERIAGAPIEIAARLRRAVRERVGLPITVGVARTKFLAKVASGVAKPDGLLVVPPERELAFLHRLPVERLWGVGRVTADKLRSRGITTVGQVAQVPEAALVAMLGRASGRHLHALAHNRDPRPVVVGRRRGSVGSQHALGRSPTITGRGRRDPRRDRRPRHPATARRPARRAGPSSFVCASTTSAERPVRTRSFARPRTPTRSWRRHAGCSPTATPLIERRGLTLVGLAVSNLEDDSAVQLPLPFDPRSDVALDEALDVIRVRFGSTAIKRAVLLGREERPAVPLLFD